MSSILKQAYKESKEGQDSNKDEGTEAEQLSRSFQATLELYEEMKTSPVPTNDPGFQKKVRDGIARLEDMTREINELSLFSANEQIEEVSTENLKFLLLPAFLADFSTRNQSYDRLDMLEHAEVYYRDYIQRLNDYGVCDIELKKDNDESKDEPAGPGKIKRDPLVASAIFRESKINRYREAQRLEEQLLSLKQLICEQENSGGATIDEEVERKFYLTLITQWLARAVDELGSIEQEKPMAKMRAAHLASEKDHLPSGGPGSGGPSRRAGLPLKPKPLQPIIITRDQAQKKVYGIGYPSIPTVTVDEFINQKVSDGTLAFNNEKVYGNSLYDWASNPDKKQQESDDEEERKEKAEEDEDPDELKRKRAWDDWKDDHRRGEGNRHNMG